jgi:hypothetical protein
MGLRHPAARKSPQNKKAETARGKVTPKKAGKKKVAA